jgi:hypothetical protein
MVPDKAEAAQRFARDLRELRQRAGRPSYSILERVSAHRLKRATVSDVLNGNRVNVPEWWFVALFVEACRAAALESKLDLRDLGSVADWKRHWDAASNGVVDARYPGSARPVPTARESQPAQSAGTREPDDQAAIADSAGSAGSAPPATWGSLPPRLTDFVGRESWLADLHRTLGGGNQSSPVAVQGLCGIGKTQLAVEYAYRRAGEYDLIWWIPCDDATSTHHAMAELRDRLGAQDELFDILRRGEPYARWLLIFDGADEPDEIRQLLPPAGGHVLVTSRNSRWEATGRVLEIETFSREESIEFLRRRMPRSTLVQAHRIAEAVGDLPLLLEHAAESRAEIEEYLAQLHSDPQGLLDSQPSDYPARVGEQWRQIIDRLRDDNPSALNLLNCLCFFGRAPIPREALERGSFLANASVHDLLRDPIRRNLAIMVLRRTGLLRVDTGTRTLAIHPVTRYIARDMIAMSGAADAERSRHDVHLLLAAADPLNPSDPANWRSYEQLREHAAEADIEGCSNEAVRKLVVNLVHFLNAAGDSRAALRMADSALRRWTAEGGDELAAALSGCLAMHRARIDALFACCRHQEAYQFQQDTVELMRSAPGDWGDEVILLGAVPGAYSRMLGRFNEAHVADLGSRAEYVRRFDREHPHSFTSASDLILDLALVGRFDEAVHEATQVYDDCLAFYNDHGYPAVLFQRNMLARCQWLNGQYGAAAATMTGVHAGYVALADREILDENHPWRLAHEIDFAAVQRDHGAAGADLDVLVANTQDVHRRCWRTLGVDHPQTLAALVTQGTIIRHIRGRATEAVRVLAEAERRYRSALPGHPFTYACAGYLTVVRRLAGHGASQEDESSSVAELEEVVARLTELVGAGHPLTLSAATWVTNLLVHAGESGQALDRGTAALAASRAVLGKSHPHTLACEANVTTIRAGLGQEPDLNDIRARYGAAIGVGHRDVKFFAEGRMIYIDFTPLPL